MSPNKINLSKFTIKLIYLAVPNRALQSQKLQVHIKIKIFMYNLDIFSQSITPVLALLILIEFYPSLTKNRAFYPLKSIRLEHSELTVNAENDHSRQ